MTLSLDKRIYGEYNLDRCRLEMTVVSSMEKMVEGTLVEDITPGVSYHLYSRKEWLRTSACVPSEMPLTIFVNNQELVTVLCTPSKLNCLVIGYLYSEGVISGVHEIASMRICEGEPIADVRLNRDFTMPPRRTLTSGCGSGVSFGAQVQPLDSDLVVVPEELLALMKQLYQQQSLFQQCGGIHCSALCDLKQILVLAEDIGRHNTLDKILGESLLRKMPTRNGILLTTGRISSEMLLKAARMQVAVVVSRGSPTERAIGLGHDLNIAVVGYARGNRLSVFSAEERLLAAAGNQQQ